MSPRLVGNHNRSWIWGRNVVLETLRGEVWKPLQVCLSPRCHAEFTAEIQRRSAAWGVPVQQVSDAELHTRCRAEDHQGLAAQMPPFPYRDLSDLVGTPDSPRRWLVLDGVQDSFNVGAMLRSALELGTDAVLLGAAGQSGINSQVARSSAGAVNHLPIARCDPLTAGVELLQQHHVKLIAASEKATHRLQDIDWSGATAIIVGNEGRGVSPGVWSLCDAVVQIPTTNRIGSLNAAVAAGICCYERWRQLSEDTHSSDGTTQV